MDTVPPSDSIEPPPDPAGVGTLDEVAEYLRRLRAWALHVSYPELVRRINRRRGPRSPVSQTTVYDCFRSGRARMDGSLVLDIAAALGLDQAAQARLREALRRAQGDPHAPAAAQVRPLVPPPSPLFTGRARELEQIVDRWDSTGTTIVITGAAGIGKTELALAAAAQLAQRDWYADGRFFVDMRGFDPDRAPVTAVAVMAGLLRQLGVDDTKVHSCRGPEQRAGLLRRAVTDRAVLVVLDNAAGPEQLRWLLPGLAPAGVLVTSWHRFDQLTGGAVVPLDALNTDDALDLLRRHDPHGRVDAEPETARRIADQLCFRLPLDLVAVGAQLADPREAGWSLADHAARLASFPPDEVSRPALASSYHSLPRSAQLVFRLLSVHPGRDVTGYDAATLADLDLAGAAAALRELYDRHLLRRVAGRFQFHDVVHAYARRLLTSKDPASRQDAATARLRHYHLYTAAHAGAYYAPPGRKLPSVPAPQTPTPEIPDLARARTWLDDERPNLLATALHAADHGDLTHTAVLSELLAHYLNASGYWQDAAHLFARASDTDDPDQRGKALSNLGSVRLRLGRYDQAIDDYRRALACFQRLGNQTWEGYVLSNLGMVHSRLGRSERALRLHHRALDLSRELGNRYGELIALINIAADLIRQGVSTEAAERSQQALELARDLGDRPREVRALNNLGFSYMRSGRDLEALDCYQAALEIVDALGDRYGASHLLTNLGSVHERLGQLDTALGYQQQALDICLAIGNQEAECEVRNNLGTVLRLTGRLVEAMDQHQAALRVALEIGKDDEAARARNEIVELDRR